MSDTIPLRTYSLEDFRAMFARIPKLTPAQARALCAKIKRVSREAVTASKAGKTTALLPRSLVVAAALASRDLGGGR